MRLQEGCLERPTWPDLVDASEEAEVGRNSRPTPDDIPSSATFGTAVDATGPTFEDGKERASCRLIGTEIDKHGQGSAQTERRCDLCENVSSSPLMRQRRWLRFHHGLGRKVSPEE